MKDSQKKKKKQRKKVNKSAVPLKKEGESLLFSTTHNKKSIANFYQSLKKHFFWIIASVTIINIFLGIAVIYLIGKIEESVITARYTEISVPDLPVLPNTPDLNISAESLIVYEKDSRVVVFEKKGSLRFSPASTTKIMTALVALESYDLKQYLPANGVSTVLGSKMGLVEGEEVRVEDLLYGLMLPSGNDAAFVLAQNYPGGRKKFMDRMNEKTRELRLYNTFFVDPAGLEDENYTTAFDLARLALVALQNKEFKRVVETKQVTVYDKTFTHEHRLENLNQLLNKKGVFGVKTGYTQEAGQVLVTSFESKAKTYIIVVLKSTDRFWDTEQILAEVVQKVQLETF